MKRNLHRGYLWGLAFIIFTFLFSLNSDYNKYDTVVDNIEVVDKFEQMISVIKSYQSTITFFFISGPRIMNQIAKCCVVSAAKLHPKQAVVVFVNGIIKQPLSWKRYKNIFPVQLSENFLFKETPLQKWYVNDTWRQSYLWDYHLGDALRLAYLWKYGGIYLDTDVFVLKNLEDFRNSLAFENVEKSAIDGAVLIFDKTHPFINLAMNKFVDEFRDEWAYQGPSLMMRTYETYKSLQLDSLAVVNVLNSSTFYPLSWKNLEIRKIFQKNYFKQVSDKIHNSFVVHLWNKASKSFRLEKGSYLDDLISNHC